MNSWKPATPLLVLGTVEVTLGLLCVASAALQAANIHAFAVTIAAYHIVRDPTMIRLLSVLIVAVEVLVAGVLFFGWRGKGWTYALLLLLAGALAGLLLYSRLVNGTRKCLCFGHLIASMRVCLAICGLLSLLLVIALVALRRAKAGLGMNQTGLIREWRKPLTLVSLVAVLSAGLFAGSADPVYRSAQEATDCRGNSFCGLTVEWREKRWDLSQGVFFVAMLNTDCELCHAAIHELNEIGQILPEETPIVGLSLGNDESLEEFKIETEPDFPILLLGPIKFFSLVEKGVPTFQIVYNGEIKNTWLLEVPTQEEVLESLLEIPEI